MYLLVDSCNKVQDLDTFPYEIQNGHATFWFSTALHKGLAQNNDNIHKKNTINRRNTIKNYVQKWT